MAQIGLDILILCGFNRRRTFSVLQPLLSVGMPCLLDAINWLCHVPWVEDWIYYSFWAAVGLATPIICLLILAYDHLSGYILCLFHKSEKFLTGRPIFITGCDSGFGKELATRLAHKGMKVYAACLTDKGVENIRKQHPGVVGVKLDVTQPEQVQAVADQVAAENPRGLYALVNNAGVSRSGLVEWASVDDYRFCMEVNYFAVISVTKAFLPLLKRSKGRILVMSSAAGMGCGYPVTSPYSCSKHAVENFASTLRQEMKVWGIKVVTLNPGFHRTEINHSASAGLLRLWERLDEHTKAEYGADYIKAVVQSVDGFTKSMALHPVHVIDAYEQAITACWPRSQYRVGIDSKYLFPWLQITPLRIGELLAYYSSTNRAMRRVKGVLPIKASEAATKKISDVA